MEMARDQDNQRWGAAKAQEKKHSAEYSSPPKCAPKTLNRTCVWRIAHGWKQRKQCYFPGSSWILAWGIRNVLILNMMHWSIVTLWSTKGAGWGSSEDVFWPFHQPKFQFNVESCWGFPNCHHDFNPMPQGIFTFIWLIFMVNVGKNTIHGCYENDSPHFFQTFLGIF